MDCWERRIEQLNGHVIHVQYIKEEKAGRIIEGISSSQNQGENLFSWNEQEICFGRHQIRVREIGCEFQKIETFHFVPEGTPVYEQVESANGTVTVLKNGVKKFDKYMHQIRLTFESSKDEMLFGLGQHENGIYNYKGKTEYLYQNNMKISIPFLMSTDNYGILIDTESSLVFESKDTLTTFLIYAEEKLSYYVILGDDFDEIIYHLRELTGRASMLPRWAFGYMQSKEKYSSQKELLETGERFRREDIPIDCLVQDWCTWEDKKWGQKTVDKHRYPDLPRMVSQLHDMHIKLMVSVWPNMDAGTENHSEFEKNGMLLPNSNLYDAYKEKARDIYWKQCSEEWFRAGIDAWWCDNSEPFTASDWCGAVKRSEKKRFEIIMKEAHNSAPWNQVNSYGLWHGKGIYEHWRLQCPSKRVVNLSRSTYISGQKYGIIPWSGDITAKWSTMKIQIAEGLKMCMTGMPYWTLDIGGFFTVRDKWENRGCNMAGDPNPLWFWDGDYNDGVEDAAYCELYTRWLEYATFLPIFRSHGTDTPREPWNFGQKGTIFYDAILKFIRLRYRLLPYIYSSAAAVTREHKTIMRSLLFDFKQDKRVWEIQDSYMFGDAFLVSPVTRPMYYEKGGKACDCPKKEKEVYLPQGTVWYNYWTKEKYEGGQCVNCATPIDKIPLFVHAGAIIPLSGDIDYADERQGKCNVIEVYDGADGNFSMYFDAGDGYAYEIGEYCLVRLEYRNNEKSLYLANAEGSMRVRERLHIRLISSEKVTEVQVVYNGEKKKINL